MQWVWSILKVFRISRYPLDWSHYLYKSTYLKQVTSFANRIQGQIVIQVFCKVYYPKLQFSFLLYLIWSLTHFQPMFDLCRNQSMTCIFTWNITAPQVVFKHFGSKIQLPGLSIIEILVENGLRNPMIKMENYLSRETTSKNVLLWQYLAMALSFIF